MDRLDFVQRASLSGLSGAAGLVILVHLRGYFAALELVSVIGLTAGVAAKQMLVGPKLPVDVSPSDPVLLADEGNELFQIPVFVTLVFKFIYS